MTPIRPLAATLVAGLALCLSLLPLAPARASGPWQPPAPPPAQSQPACPHGPAGAPHSRASDVPLRSERGPDGRPCAPPPRDGILHRLFHHGRR